MGSFGRSQSNYITSTAFQFYFDSTAANALKQKEYANSKINEPLFVFQRNFTFNINRFDILFKNHRTIINHFYLVHWRKTICEEGYLHFATMESFIILDT